MLLELGSETTNAQVTLLAQKSTTNKLCDGWPSEGLEHFSDQLNSISKPSQMGPSWVEAKHLSEQPIDEHLWVNNPVDTSHPACMAFKAAENQSFIAGEAIIKRSCNDQQ